MNKIIQKSSNWYSFKFNEYEGEAKIYDIGSQYGIDGGRISKLYVTRNGQVVFNYDRGEDHNEISQNALEAILTFLNTATFANP